MATTTKALTQVQSEARRRAVSIDFLYKTPWWGLFLLIIGIYIYVLILSDGEYSAIVARLGDGVIVTLRVSAISYVIAMLIGLGVGLVRANPPVPITGTWGAHVRGGLRVLLYNLATFYVSILRGLPILVVLLIVAFVVVPALRNGVNSALGTEWNVRGTSEFSAVVALSLTYGAFLSETFRAGIQSVDRGQVEAARSLGMQTRQVMRLIVLPQAIRRILPPLGNDMIAMIKDSSLVAILGIEDITQLGKLYSSTSFKFMQTYLVVATLYLTLTIIGSILVRTLERRLQTRTR